MLPQDKPIIPGDSCYFLTLNVVDKIDVFVRPAYKNVITNALNHFVDHHGITVYAWCLMASHLHLLLKSKDGNGPAYFERDFKKYTTPEIVKAIEMEMDLRRDWMMRRFEEHSQSLKKLEKFDVWQNCSGPLHIDCRQPGLLEGRIEHIHENPVRERIVDAPEMYLYSSARDYAGGKGLVKVQVVARPGFARFKMLSPN